MRVLIGVAALVLSAGVAHAQTAGRQLLQQPALSRTHIVFVHGGDLWSVPREGGAASRLTSGPGAETGPVFSADGTKVAFTGEYDGNIDVFVIPAAGGIPKRLTYHPTADAALGFTPDGNRVLFRSTRTARSRYAELFTIGLDGGLPQTLPLPMAAEGSYSEDGARIAYVPLQRAFATWKRYRGGQTTPIWLATLANSKVEKVPRENSNDFNPMWVGDKVYFLSDRDGRTTLFGYDTQTRKVARLFDNDGFDLKSASAGPGGIVFEQFGSLGLFDLATGRRRPVAVTVTGDFPEVRERLLRVGTALTNGHLSPTAMRAIFEAHGDIITVPAEKGDPRNLTNTPGIMERDPAWSPDGKSVAYFSDESGEYALHVRPQTGTGDVIKIALGEKPSIYLTPRWSPDSKRLAFIDSHQTLWCVDLETKKPVRVDRDRFWSRSGDILLPSWSPDSKWLAYAKRLPNYLGGVFVYSVAGGQSTAVTDGMSDARAPVFDAEGKYLYFTASTDAGASAQPDIHSFSRPVSRSIYLIVLSKDDPSPFAPESDEEKGTEEKPPGAAAPKPEGADQKPDGPALAGAAGAPKPPGPGAPSKAVTVKIDFENILQRVLAMPIPARRYVSLQAGKAGVLLASEATDPFAGGAPAPGVTVHRYDLKARKADVAISGVSGFEIARNGEKMLYRQGERWFITALRPMPTGSAAVPPAPPAAPGTTGALTTDTIEVRVDPRAEWRQMYREAWRIQREFFYDPGYHGLDLAAAEKRYEPFLEGVASRSDLNYLFAEMLGDITVSHLGVGGGTTPEVRRVATGLLGADFAIENGHYRFARIYNGENWNPQLRAPLTQPGVNVVAGEYLLSVDGRPLTGSDSVFVGSPSSAVWDPATSQWIAENIGVAPDIEVEQDPELVRQGKDPQLDKAIEVVMAELAKSPQTAPKRPAYPEYKR